MLFRIKSRKKEIDLNLFTNQSYDKAEIVLYHHLDYNRYGLIQSRYKHIIECLNLADKMDTFLHLKEEKLEKDFFNMYRDIKLSGAALDLFHKAEARYGITCCWQPVFICFGVLQRITGA